MLLVTVEADGSRRCMDGKLEHWDANHQRCKLRQRTAATTSTSGRSFVDVHRLLDLWTALAPGLDTAL